MPEWLIPIFVFYLIYLYSAMTTSKSTTVKSAPNAKTAKPVAAVAAEEKQVKPISAEKTAVKAKTTTAKPAAKAKAEKPVETSVTKPAPTKRTKALASEATAPKSEIPVAERVGLTAGSIWQYLSTNGASAVSKLVKKLPEEDKIIQRSIGWLAQEGKITLSNVDGIETISLDG